MKRKSIKTLLIISLLLISTSLVACQGSRASNEEAAPEVESTSPALAPVATSESVSDALVEMAKEELAQSLGVPIEQIRLDSVTSLDVDADTYSIKLQSEDGQIYEYHTQGNSVMLVSEPLPTAPATEETAVSAPVPVDTITITVMSETQVQVIASGNLLQGCDVLNEPEVTQKGQTFQITLTRNEMIQRPCTDALVPFEKTIDLDVTDIPAGEYTVEVNGVSQTFMWAEGTTMISPEQITFTLDGLAGVVITESVPAAEATVDTPYWAIYPEHLQFTFDDYVLTDVLQQAQIRIYPVNAYETINETAAVEIERLRTLLAERPETIPDPAPFLPLANANQMIWARATYLDFQMGSGVRYLTQYAQAIVPVNNQELFYTFQGLTADEMYYVSAVFPVSHPDLSVNAGDIPDGFEESFDTYLANAINQLEEADAATYTPDLALLDSFVQSIAIESDVTPIEGADSLMAALQAAGAAVTQTREETVPFFPLPALFWQVNGAEVQVIELESEQQQQSAAALIQDNGYTINGTAVDWPETPHFWAEGQLIVLYVGDNEAVVTLLTGTLGMPFTGEPSIMEGSYPAAVGAAIALFSQDTGIGEDAVEIISVTESEWPGGCLGLAEEGEVCTLAIVPGFQIMAQAQDNNYEIRSNEAGTVMRWQLLTTAEPYP